MIIIHFFKFEIKLVFLQYPIKNVVAFLFYFSFPFLLLDQRSALAIQLNATENADFHSDSSDDCVIVDEVVPRQSNRPIQFKSARSINICAEAFIHQSFGIAILSYKMLFQYLKKKSVYSLVFSIPLTQILITKVTT